MVTMWPLRALVPHARRGSTNGARLHRVGSELKQTWLFFVVRNMASHCGTYDAGK